MAVGFACTLYDVTFSQDAFVDYKNPVRYFLAKNGVMPPEEAAAV